MDTAFRKIDIDAYDEDAFLESELFEPDSRNPTQVLSDAKQKQTAVRSSLAKYVVVTLESPQYFNTCSFNGRGDTVGALTIALADAPYGPGVDEAKANHGLGAAFHVC